jgi:hypothetical protein
MLLPRPITSLATPVIVTTSNPAVDFITAILLPIIILNFITGSLNFAYAVVALMASTSMEKVIMNRSPSRYFGITRLQLSSRRLRIVEPVGDAVASRLVAGRAE